jgi:hypothetical protein
MFAEPADESPSLLLSQKRGLGGRSGEILKLPVGEPIVLFGLIR